MGLVPSVPRPRALGPGRFGPHRRPASSSLAAPPDLGVSARIVDCAIYDAGCRQGGRRDWREAIDQVEQTGAGFVWIGLHEPSEAQFAGLAERFGLHPLAVEDAVHAPPAAQARDLR